MTTGGSGFWTSGAVPLIEPEILSGIIAAASDIALVLDGKGTILSVVVSAGEDGFGNLDHWEKRPIVDFLSTDSIGKFQKAHQDYLSGDGPGRPVQLNHEDNAAWGYPVRYTFHRFGAGDTVLMLGRDLRPIAETQQQLVQAQIALEQGYESRREFDARYRMILSKSHEAILFISVVDGRVIDCSEAAADVFGLARDALNGSVFAQVLEERSPGELMESLLNASLADGGGTVEVRASGGTGPGIAITPSVFRAGGQRILLCIAQPSSDGPRVADADAVQAATFLRSASDAILFTDTAGAILSGNDSFLDLIGAAHGGDIKGRSLADYLVRGQIDLNVLTENARRTGHMRIYATKLQNELGARLSVEISATHMTENAPPLLAFVIRDVSRVEGVRGPASHMPDDNGRNVMELVGSASLKEIVAETTDVVEKMCIETAVKLTQNNRVAAAEMLGLSRQSLYVKLRKYGLLNKNG